MDSNHKSSLLLPLHILFQLVPLFLIIPHNVGLPYNFITQTGEIFFLNFYFYFILLYNTVLVLPYIDMNPPRVYMSSQSLTPLPPPTPYHLSGSSRCRSPKHPVSCIKHRLAIRFLHDSIHVSMPHYSII